MLSPLVLSIGIGLVVCLIFVGYLGLSTGGMVVPGYFALVMNHPNSVILTLIVALVVFGIVKVLSRFLIIYGRRRIAMIMLIGFILGALFRYLFSSYTFVENVGGVLTVIGYIIPGLIALSFDRQGMIETTASLLVAASIVRILLILLIPAQVLTL